MVILRNSTIEIRDARDVARVFQDLLRLEDRIDQDKEHFYVMHVNSRRQINLVELVSVGTLNEAPFHPRETFRRAVIEGSYSIIVAHNHPTGDVTPSEGDIRTTNCTTLVNSYKFPYWITLSSRCRTGSSSALRTIKRNPANRRTEE
jgi:DNA repair protein RadC